MNTNAFYDAMADRLGLPREATSEFWNVLRRRIVMADRVRRYEGLAPLYGIEATAQGVCSKPAAHNPDEAMIARDGPAKPVRVVERTPSPAITAKPALAGLMRLAAVDHRLGSAFR